MKESLVFLTITDMSGSTLLVVLFAAILHASWNAMVRAGPNKLLSTVMITTGAGLIAIPFLAVVGTPASPSWIWLGASACCQVAYYQLLAQAYKHGEMSQAYPLMRGTAPLLVTCVSASLLGEALSIVQYAAIGLITGGVLAMNIGRSSVPRSSMYAFVNAFMIASYTIIDGIGVRVSGSSVAYTLWLFALTAVGMLVSVFRQREHVRAYAWQNWATGLWGGLGTMASYGMALWAMMRAPVALVAALRETSILFGALIGIFVLRERVNPQRLVAVTMIGIGAVVMRFTH